MQLSTFVKKMNNNAFECQRQLYFAARSAPVNLSHQQIISKSKSVKQGIIIGYGLGGYLSHVEFHKCSTLGTLTPLSNINKDDAYAVFNMLYNLRSESKQLTLTKAKVAKNLLSNVQSKKQQADLDSRSNVNQETSNAQNKHVGMPELESAIIEYYDNNGVWAGKFRIQSIEKIRTEQTNSKIVAHVRYAYQPVGKNSRKPGFDQRIFYIEKNKDSFRVLRMGPHMSASFLTL